MDTIMTIETQESPLDTLIGRRGAATVRRYAATLGMQIRVGGAHITLRDNDDAIAQFHRDDDGRWVAARWDGGQAQWTGDSPDGRVQMGDAYRRTYARTLHGLRRAGVPSYATAAAAVRAELGWDLAHARAAGGAS